MMSLYLFIPTLSFVNDSYLVLLVSTQRKYYHFFNKYSDKTLIHILSNHCSIRNGQIMLVFLNIHYTCISLLLKVALKTVITEYFNSNYMITNQNRHLPDVGPMYMAPPPVGSSICELPSFDISSCDQSPVRSLSSYSCSSSTLNCPSRCI